MPIYSRTLIIFIQNLNSIDLQHALDKIIKYKILAIILSWKEINNGIIYSIRYVTYSEW